MLLKELLLLLLLLLLHSCIKIGSKPGWASANTE
jgi:hypothetical protein